MREPSLGNDTPKRRGGVAQKAALWLLREGAACPTALGRAQVRGDAAAGALARGKHEEKRYGTTSPCIEQIRVCLVELDPPSTCSS